MDSYSLFGTCFITGDAYTPPVRHNDNQRLMEEWMTPAELFQWIHRTREEMRRERAADPRLLTCPKHRRDWESLHVLERCALWRYRGVQ